MANKSLFPGATQFAQAMNCIGSLIFERGLRGDLDIAVSTTRIGGDHHYRLLTRWRDVFRVYGRRTSSQESGDSEAARRQKREGQRMMNPKPFVTICGSPTSLLGRRSATPYVRELDA